MSDMWYLLQDYERYVYHYTQSASLLEHILPQQRLRLSRFKNVNDPRESKDWVLSFWSIAADLTKDMRRLEGQINLLIKHSWRLGCFVRDPHDAVMGERPGESGAKTLMRAYLRGHSHPRMWAQYAGDHHGACLVFDKVALGRAVRAAAAASGSLVYDACVEYEDPPFAQSLHKPDPLRISLDDVEMLGVEKAVDRHVAEFWQQLFFSKPLDWAQEYEFRWLVRARGDEDFFVGIEDSLVGIALGDLFRLDDVPAIERYAKTHRVDVVNMRWQNGLPQPQPAFWASPR